MKTTRLMIASAILSFAATGAAYADSGSHTPTQIFPDQAEKTQIAPARQAELPAARAGWNKGSQYSTEWLTRATDARSETGSADQSPASAARSGGKNCNLKPMTGFNRRNSFEHSC